MKVRKTNAGTKNITLRSKIILRDDWNSLTFKRKAVILAHEFVHVKQWRTIKGFGLKYIFNSRFRWRSELEAEKQAIKAMRSIGISKDNVSKYIDVASNVIYENYKLQQLDKNMVREQTYKELMKGNVACYSAGYT